MLVQRIVPEVIEWITRQAQAGHKPEDVLAAMRRSGWHDDVERAAIEQSQRGSQIEAPPPISVPEPPLCLGIWLGRL